MITCSVCGELNSPGRATCWNCGSDLSDSPDWGTYDDNLNFDETDELGYADSDFYD